MFTKLERKNPRVKEKDTLSRLWWVGWMMSPYCTTSFFYWIHYGTFPPLCKFFSIRYSSRTFEISWQIYIPQYQEREVTLETRNGDEILSSYLIKVIIKIYLLLFYYAILKFTRKKKTCSFWEFRVLFISCKVQSLVTI